MSAEGLAAKEESPKKREVKTHTLTCKTDQSIKQVPVALRDLVVFFIGGAGDQESYYGTGPNNNIDYVRRITVDDAKQLEILKRCPSWVLNYNAFISDEDLEKNVLSRIPNCSTAIYIVGHSLGGWNGAHLSSVLADRGFKVRMLITLDPVGEGKIVYGISSIYRREPKPKADYWVNIRAAAVDWNVSDLVADFGEQWEVRQGPDVMGRVDINHADANRMFVQPLPGGKTARQIFNESILSYFRE
ncbi:alpha/beta hydrolase [Pseudomonas sp. PDM10]|uniref:alpha/beta hydrolase n=1 Tax=Pseudomonas sp. PDM10 TaxID=2769269 RepID=UPI0017872A98|nr:alpha/beta hydrolase [Pseudomonas sp. PDM10]MBD9603734.1 alpha/beta hydrolase [Pseudomonas sp. PDM10]